MADTYTTTYNLTKIEFNSSENTWGTKEAANLDLLDDLLDGTSVLTGTKLNTLSSFVDNTDNTKQALFDLTGLTTATSRTYTLPNYDATLATIAGTETLTNKTLTAPTLADPAFSGTATGLSATSPSLTTPSIATSATLTGATNDWTFALDGDDLVIQYNGVDVFKLTTAGAIIAKDDITAFGTP